MSLIFTICWSVINLVNILYFSKNGKLTKFKNWDQPLGDSSDWWADHRGAPPDYCKIYVASLKKYNFKVFPLSRNRMGNSDVTLTYQQLLHYVNQTNYKNIWKGAFNRYPNSYANSTHQTSHSNSSSTSSSSLPTRGVPVVTYDELLREIIKRMYNCRIVHYKLDYIYAPPPDSREASAMDKPGVENLYSALCAIETSTHYYLIYDNCIEYTLLDCVTHSPAILEESYNKILFLIYQLIALVKNLHEMGLLLGEITMNDIYLRENLFLQVFPVLRSNIFQYKATAPTTTNCHKSATNERNPDDSHTNRGMLRSQMSIPREPLSSTTYGHYSLRDYCRMWCTGELSNYDYLTVLNNAVGRRMDVPEYHHIMPWVSDLEHRNGQNWRDFHKSKFRLNKGDPQLELTYQTQEKSVSDETSNAIPHHVTDVLSEITYYVYKARRTPQKLLCKQVRPNWVPAEYPVSIQRLQEWTPDECIPEFYSDPQIFKSIHEDLPDLEVPKWATCPEDFIQKHREALESQHVSERLHHWIDLNYGYKLSGAAAVKAKNVCLSLVDDHRNLCRRGLVQLFSHPHPARIIANGAQEKCPPRISWKLERGRSTENVFQLEPVDRVNDVALERSSSFYTTVLPSGPIKLPLDYNPLAHLNAVEEMEVFLNRTFSMKSQEYDHPKSIAQEERPGDEQKERDCFGDMPMGYTNRLFEDGGHSQTEQFTATTMTNYKQTVAQARARELQIVGCLIVELLLVSKLRPSLVDQNGLSFERRLATCREVFNRERLSLPKCIEYPLQILLESRGENGKADVVLTERGLPPPSAHQFLQPLLNNSLFPFPHEYVQVMSILGTIFRFDRLVQLLDLYSFEGTHRTESARLSIQRKLVRCKINLCVAQMEGLLTAKGYDQFDSLEIILPFFVEMLNAEDSSAMAAWNLFDMVAASLGTEKTKQYLLAPILNLYENKTGAAEGSRRISKVSKEIKLYHHSLLLRLIVRFGLKTFLENFITPLVEAVGGIKDEVIVQEEHLVNKTSRDSITQAPKNASDGVHAEAVQKIEEEIFNLEIAEDDFMLKTPEGLSGDPVGQSTPANSKSVGGVKTRKVIKSKTGQSKSEVSFVSLIWLSHRLGCVLTTRYVTRKLLKMLTLCYVGEENLLPEVVDADTSPNTHLRLSSFTVTNSRVCGDQKAARVLDCLTSISVLFGEQLILIQYFPHLSELVALCKKKIVASLEGALISGLELIKHLVPYLNDTILMEQLQGTFLQNFIHPIIRILATSPMPGGFLARSVLARKLIDTIYILAIRIGREMTKEHLCVPALQRFFSIFNRAQDDAGSIKSAGSDDSEVDQRLQIFEDIQMVFTPEFAFSCYVPFLNYLGESVMQSALKNFPLILVLCQEHEKPPGRESNSFVERREAVEEEGEGGLRVDHRSSSRDIANELLSAAMDASITECSNSFGSQVIGNRIEMRKDRMPDATVAVNDVLGLVTYKTEKINMARHLRGNWLAYWEHENCRPDKDESWLDVKQIKLQTFTGHVNAVKNLLVLDNENSFMSASKDKTVKLWSLKSEGDGTKMCQAQWTYGNHKKSVHSLAFLESMRLAVSCDSTVHVWDPFVGAPVGQLERYAGVSVIKTCPTPSALVMAGTMDSTVKIIDVRCMAYVVNDWKLTNMASGPVRSIAMAPSGNWMTVGLSSGQLYNLDTRMGMILSSWRPTEGELLQVAVPNEEQIITSTLDHNISVWSVADGVQQFEFQ